MISITSLIYEQINWDTTNRLFRLKTLSSFSDIWLLDSNRIKKQFERKDFLSPEYIEEMSKPLVSWEEKMMNKDNFYQTGNDYFFKTRWQDIETEMRRFSKYILFLPEYAVPSMVKFTDPLKPSQSFTKFVFKDLTLKRYYILIFLASKYGRFNFDLICRFHKEEKNYENASFDRDINTIEIDYDMGIDAVLKEEKEFDLKELNEIITENQIEKTRTFFNFR